jgi:hypothetical protein
MTDAPVLASDVKPESTFEPFKVGKLNITTEKQRLAWLKKLTTNAYHRVPLQAVRLADVNPNKGDVAAAIESLREFGQHRAAVVQQAKGEIVVGNHMLKGMQALGWKELDIFLVADDDEKAMRRAITDNAVGRRASWEEAELARVMEDIGPVPGFDQGDLDALLAKLTPPADKEEPTYPLVARLNEHYDYVVIFAENETDWVWLQTRFDLRHEKSYKSQEVYFSHVLTVSRAQEVLDGKKEES